jgi:hypothetical protein
VYFKRDSNVAETGTNSCEKIFGGIEKATINLRLDNQVVFRESKPGLLNTVKKR